MRSYSFRQRNPGGEQEGGPIDAVLARDFLRHSVQIGGPEAREIGDIFGCVGAVADGGHVVGECIEPDVDDVFLFGFGGGGFGDWDSPGEGAAGDGEVFQGSGDVGGACGGRGDGALRGSWWRLGKNAGVLRFAQNDNVFSSFRDVAAEEA